MRFLSLLWLASLVAGNVEKTIFVAPAAINLSQDGPGLETLCLKSLSTQSQETRLRLSLPVKFASHEYPAGETSWYLLQNLSPGQRYEVRICWAATQPTNFRLDSFSINEVLNSPRLIANLSNFAHAQNGISCKSKQSKTQQSTLFLRIEAAADFYSSDQERMLNPPPILVDVILDPFLFNVIPQSLVGTGLYIVVVAILAFILSGYVWNWLVQQGPPKLKPS